MPENTHSGGINVDTPQMVGDSEETGGEIEIEHDTTLNVETSESGTEVELFPEDRIDGPLSHVFRSGQRFKREMR